MRVVVKLIPQLFNHDIVRIVFALFPEFSGVKQLVLHDFQQELVKYALRGQNSVLAAPSWTGKTHVATAIIKVRILRCK